MHNFVGLIGRLTDNPELKKYDEGKTRLSINLAVQRDYKSEDGLYGTDFIRCVLWNGIANHVNEYCHKGDLLAVKGRLQSRSYEENEEKKYISEVIVDRVSFLSSRADQTTQESSIEIVE